MNVTPRRSRLAAAGVGLTLLIGACSAAPAPQQPDPAGGAEVEAPGDDEGSGEENPGGDGDYVFGTDRDQIATAIVAPFKNRGGEAWWEGDTLVLALDDDKGGPIPGFTECRVIEGFLTEGDSAVIEFPDGRVDCAEVLSDL